MVDAYDLATAVAFAKANRKAKFISVSRWGLGRIKYQLERAGFVDTTTPPKDMNTRRDPWAAIDKQLWYERRKMMQLAPVYIMGIMVRVS